MAPIKVHRVVVAACSPTLEAMLCHDMRDSVKGSITLQDIAPTALDELVRFMYTDSLLIGPDTASALLAASDMLGMTSAKELCINWLEKHVNTESVVTVLNLAERHGCHELQDVCELHICKHFTECKTAKEAETAPVQRLSEVQLSRILVTMRWTCIQRLR